VNCKSTFSRDLNAGRANTHEDAGKEVVLDLVFSIVSERDAFSANCSARYDSGASRGSSFKLELAA
jgi:hypothetical protein